MIGDRVDVEEDRAGDVTFEIFRLGVAFFARKEKSGVENRDIGRVQIFGQPRGRDEERFLMGCCHSRASHITWRTWRTWHSAANRTPKRWRCPVAHDSSRSGER